MNVNRPSNGGRVHFHMLHSAGMQQDGNSLGFLLLNLLMNRYSLQSIKTDNLPGFQVRSMSLYLLNEDSSFKYDSLCPYEIAF